MCAKSRWNLPPQTLRRLTWSKSFYARTNHVCKNKFPHWIFDKIGYSAWCSHTHWCLCRVWRKPTTCLSTIKCLLTTHTTNTAQLIDSNEPKSIRGVVNPLLRRTNYFRKWPNGFTATRMRIQHPPLPECSSQQNLRVTPSGTPCAPLASPSFQTPRRCQTLGNWQPFRFYDRISLLIRLENKYISR